MPTVANRPRIVSQKRSKTSSRHRSTRRSQKLKLSHRKQTMYGGGLSAEDMTEILTLLIEIEGTDKALFEHLPEEAKDVYDKIKDLIDANKDNLDAWLKSLSSNQPPAQPGEEGEEETPVEEEGDPAPAKEEEPPAEEEEEPVPTKNDIQNRLDKLRELLNCTPSIGGARTFHPK